MGCFFEKRLCYNTLKQGELPPWRGQERVAWAAGVIILKNKALIVIMVLSLIVSACGSNEEKEKDLHNQEQLIPLFKLDKGEIKEI